MPPPNSSDKAMQIPTNQDDGSPTSDTQEKLRLSKEINDITAILNSIQKELASQSKALALLTESSTKRPMPEFPPRDKDWSEESLKTWYLSLVPDDRNLCRIRHFLWEPLVHYYRAKLELSISASIGPAVVRGNPRVFNETVERLLSAWPTELTDETRDSLNDASSRKEFDWIIPQGEDRRGSLSLEKLDMCYNAQGYPGIECQMQMYDGRLRESIPKKPLYVSNEKPWVGYKFGHIIRIALKNTNMLSLSTMAFIIWQLHHIEAASNSRLSLDYLAIPFMLDFASPWGLMSSPDCVVGLAHEVLLFRFQVRWIKIAGLASEDDESENSDGDGIEPGIYLDRDKGSIPNSVSDRFQDIALTEMRHALAIQTTMDSRLPLYTMLVLFDHDNLFMYDRYMGSTVESDIREQRFQACRCGSLTGVELFLAEIWICLESLGKKWTHSLDRLDKTLTINLAQLTPARRQKMMFDNPHFSRSEQYFAILQLLHICTDWINETIRGVRDLRNDLEKSLAVEIHPQLDTGDDNLNTYPSKEDMEENLEERKRLGTVFSRLIADSEALFQPLLDRIERKVEEVKGLRDGLFNATSVREAAKGTTLAESSSLQNRYILVFTVATIFYLPMGFVTSFYGMHLFDPNDIASASQTPFIVTFVVVSASTYVIAAAGLWFVRDWDAIRQMFTGWFKGRPPQKKQKSGRWGLPNLVSKRQQSNIAV